MRESKKRSRIEKPGRAQAADYKALAFAEAMLLSSPVGFALLDRGLRFVQVNECLARIDGLPIQEHLGRTLREVLPDLAPTLEPLYQRVLETGEPIVNQEVSGRTALAPGEVRHWLAHYHPIRAQDGTIIGIGAAVTEITERKRAEEALEQANKKLTAWVQELEQRNREGVLLSEMSDLLLSCATAEEAYAVIARSASQLFPGQPGALFVLGPSENLVEAVAVWGDCPVGEGTFAWEDCWASRRGRAHIVNDPRSELLCRHLGRAPECGYLCIPMMAQGESLGVLHLQDAPQAPGGLEGAPGWFRESKRLLAMTVSGHVALALANLKLRESLRNQSVRDHLTGLFNRRYMEESLERELRRSSRSQRPVGVIMLDLDHFKPFNDTFGHDAGDALLRELGHLLQTRTRKEDMACRYGGEEFVIVLSGASLEIAQERAEQLREKVKTLNVELRGHSLGAMTVSLGVAVAPHHGSTIAEILRAADLALYEAKKAGRDRVVVQQSSG